MDDELQLIQKAQKGDSGAFLELISRYDRQIMSVIYRLNCNRCDREDIYQEIFLACFKSIGSFKFRSSFSTWLYRVALNRSLSYMKKNTRVIEFSQGDTGDADEDANEKLKAVRSALAQINGLQKICFHLYYIEGWDIERIAETLECAPGTVKSHLYRARNRIRMDPGVLIWRTNP